MRGWATATLISQTPPIARRTARRLSRKAATRKTALCAVEITWRHCLLVGVRWPEMRTCVPTGPWSGVRVMHGVSSSSWRQLLAAVAGDGALQSPPNMISIASVPRTTMARTYSRVGVCPIRSAVIPHRARGGSVLVLKADAELPADVVEHVHDPYGLVQRQQVGLGLPSDQQPGELRGFVGQPVLPARWFVTVDLAVVGVEQAHDVRSVEPAVDLEARGGAGDRRRARGRGEHRRGERADGALRPGDRNRLARIDPGLGQRPRRLNVGEGADGEVREGDRIDAQ